MYARWPKIVFRSSMLVPLLLYGTVQWSLATPAGEVAGSRVSVKSMQLADTVRDRLSKLPYYDVFDHVAFSVRESDSVVLEGEVTRPALRTDAEVAVRNIAGVKTVTNTIRVLPASPGDEAIRWTAFKTIFEKPGLQMYATQLVSPLRIIVDHGKITLDGMVANRFDRTLIFDAARSVPGVVGVTDNLTVG
jgi:hyperosmotically inducible periplasmic protein